MTFRLCHFNLIFNLTTKIKQQEEEAAKEVLEDFCQSFEKTNKSVKMFVKGSIINNKGS